MRIEAQGKYMQNILEKAYNTLAGENNMAAAASTNFNKGNIGTQGMGAMKELIGSPLSFLPFQDLNINYGSSSGGEQQLDHEFMPTNNNENLFVEKKRPNPYSTGKSPLMMWNDHDDLGTSSTSCINIISPPFKSDDDDQIQIAPPTILDGGDENDSIIQQVEEKKKFDIASMNKLERPSPSTRATPHQTERNMSPMINTGIMAQGRSSPFG